MSAFTTNLTSFLSEYMKNITNYNNNCYGLYNYNNSFNYCCNKSPEQTNAEIVAVILIMLSIVIFNIFIFTIDLIINYPLITSLILNIFLISYIVRKLYIYKNGQWRIKEKDRYYYHTIF